MASMEGRTFKIKQNYISANHQIFVCRVAVLESVLSGDFYFFSTGYSQHKQCNVHKKLPANNEEKGLLCIISNK